MWNSKYIIGETVSVWLWKLQYLDNHLYHTHLKKKIRFQTWGCRFGQFKYDYVMILPYLKKLFYIFLSDHF